MRTVSKLIPILVCLLVIQRPAIGDAIIVSRAMKATTIMEAFLDESALRVEIEMGLDDAAAFVNLLPDEIYDQLGLPPAPLAERLHRFCTHDLVFNADGKLLEIWSGFAPYGMELDKDGRLFVADGRASKVLQIDSTGKVQNSWGEKGAKPGQFNLPHMLAADSVGNLYIAEVGGLRLQKLKRK